MCTVVTAYYNLPSKKYDNSYDLYMKWAKIFLENIPCNLIIFTSKNLVEIFKNMRRDFKDNTYIIEKEFEDLYFHSDYNFWVEQNKKDHESRHVPEVYIIWAEKISFLKQSIEINPFNTEYFIWSDIGYFRNKQNVLSRNLKFPKVEKIPANQILYLLISPFVPEDKNVDKYGICGNFQGKQHIGGGMFAGHKDSILKYYDLYLEMIEKYKLANRFCGKDQDVIASIIQENISFFKLIPAQRISGLDPWFYLSEYLST